MSTPAAIPWVQFDERVVGENHPTFDDVDNRALKFVITQSDITETQDFPGFMVRYTGSGDPNGSVIAYPPATYIDEDTGTIYVKVTGEATDTGWVEVGGGNAFGTGSPEAVVTEDIGALYEQRDAEADDHPVWFKATGTATNTGWRKFAGFIYDPAGSNAIVVGDDNDLSTVGSQAIIIGSGSGAYSNFGVAIGVGATIDATATDAIAIGSSSTANGNNGIAVGNGADTNNAVDGIAIGRIATVDTAATTGIAIGAVATVNSVDAIAIGNTATVNASSDNGIAIGESAVARGVGAIIVGLNAAHANGQASDVVIGNAATSVGGSGVCIGAASTNPAGGSTPSICILGTINATTQVGNNVVLGGTLTSGGLAVGSVCIGFSATGKDRSTSVGFLAEAQGQVAIAVGFSANASASVSLAIGWQADATNSSAIAIGNTATVAGDSALGIGKQVTAGGTGSIAIGNGATTSIAGAICIGPATMLATTGIAIVTTTTSVPTGATNCVIIGGSHTLTNIGSSCICIGNNNTTGTGANSSVIVGVGCSISGGSGVAIGNSCTILAGGSTHSVAIDGQLSAATGGANVAILCSMTAGTGNVGIGSGTTIAATGCVAIGAHTVGAAAVNYVGIGSGAPTTANCIGIGYVTHFQTRTCIIGMQVSGDSITTYVFGAGANTSTFAADILYRQSNKSSSDAVGTHWTIQPGLGTGNAAEGAFKVQIGAATASGSTLQTASVRFVVGRTVAVGTTQATNHAITVTLASTCSSALGTGINSQNTITAAANSDVMAGIRSSPSFTVGAFTGTIGVGLEIGTITGAATNLAIRSATAGMMLGTTTANTFNTAGITVAQGGADDEILAFKSSDVAHGMTTLADTDTYTTFKKATAASGGLVIDGYTAADVGVAIRGNIVTETTTKSTAATGAIDFRGQTKTGTTTTTMGADVNIMVIRSGTTTKFIFDADGDAHISNRAWVGALGITNTLQNIGLTINQGANDDEIISLKSSDVAHGMTTTTETDTYALFMKRIAASGGLIIKALSEGTIGFHTEASVTTAVTTKSAAADAATMIDSRLKSGTTTTSLGANGNILALQDSGTTRFIFDADGDSHQDVGTAWTNFDDHDDIMVLNTMAAHLTRKDEGDSVRGGLLQWLNQSRDKLTELRLVQFNDDGHHFVNMSRLTMLHTGALRQLGARFDRIEKALVAANLLSAGDYA